VIVPDANLLIYAVNQGAVQHAAAQDWWRGALSGRETVGLAWVAKLAFLRLTTNPRVFSRPLEVNQALDLLETWSSASHVVAVEPTQRHPGILRGLLEHAGTGGNLVTDAHLATLAIEHGATLCSADADFGRFRGLRWRNPLDDPAPAQPGLSRRTPTRPATRRSSG
jgi:toxin-antitoxin system PIN domain toxin